MVCDLRKLFKLIVLTLVISQTICLKNGEEESQNLPMLVEEIKCEENSWPTVTVQCLLAVIHDPDHDPIQLIVLDDKHQNI